MNQAEKSLEDQLKDVYYFLNHLMMSGRLQTSQDDKNAVKSAINVIFNVATSLEDK